jgi:ArsR family transcriptional regulator
MHVRTQRLTPELLSEVAGRFKALSEPARLRVLDALRRGPLHVSALTARTGLSQANLSKHLQVLHTNGYVCRRRDGVFAFYEIADAGVFELCDLVCGQLERSLTDRVSRLAAKPSPPARGRPRGRPGRTGAGQHHLN